MNLNLNPFLLSCDHNIYYCVFSVIGGYSIIFTPKVRLPCKKREDGKKRKYPVIINYIHTQILNMLHKIIKHRWWRRRQEEGLGSAIASKVAAGRGGYTRRR